MNHEQFKQWMHLELSSELDDVEHQALVAHLQSCAECRQEFASLKALHGQVQKSSRIVVTDELLNEARLQFRLALRQQLARRTLWQRMTDWLDAFTPTYRLAFGGVVMVLVGFLAGYFTFVSPVDDGVPSLSVRPAHDVSMSGETRISNVRFFETNGTSGEVEFTFEAVTPVRMRGKLTDERVQKVLAHALVNEQSPGVRLRTVGVLAAQPESVTPDAEIKDALIAALLRDENAGVKQEALTVLARYPFDADIKRALFTVLEREKNPGLRIEAIKVLEQAKVGGRLTDGDFLRQIQEKMARDENPYIRIRAQAFLQEVLDR